MRRTIQIALVILFIFGTANLFAQEGATIETMKFIVSNDVHVAGNINVTGQIKSEGETPAERTLHLKAQDASSSPGDIIIEAGDRTSPGGVSGNIIVKSAAPTASVNSHLIVDTLGGIRGTSDRDLSIRGATVLSGKSRDLIIGGGASGHLSDPGIVRSVTDMEVDGDLSVTGNINGDLKVDGDITVKCELIDDTQVVRLTQDGGGSGEIYLHNNPSYGEDILMVSGGYWDRVGFAPEYDGTIYYGGNNADNLFRGDLKVGGDISVDGGLEVNGGAFSVAVAPDDVKSVELLAPYGHSGMIRLYNGDMGEHMTALRGSYNGDGSNGDEVGLFTDWNRKIYYGDTDAEHIFKGPLTVGGDLNITGDIKVDSLSFLKPLDLQEGQDGWVGSYPDTVDGKWVFSSTPNISRKFTGNAEGDYYIEVELGAVSGSFSFNVRLRKDETILTQTDTLTSTAIPGVYHSPIITDTPDELFISGGSGGNISIEILALRVYKDGDVFFEQDMSVVEEFKTSFARISLAPEDGRDIVNLSYLNDTVDTAVDTLRTDFLSDKSYVGGRNASNSWAFTRSKEASSLAYGYSWGGKAAYIDVLKLMKRPDAVENLTITVKGAGTLAWNGEYAFAGWQTYEEQGISLPFFQRAGRELITHPRDSGISWGLRHVGVPEYPYYSSPMPHMDLPSLPLDLNWIANPSLAGTAPAPDFSLNLEKTSIVLEAPHREPSVRKDGEWVPVSTSISPLKIQKRQDGWTLVSGTAIENHDSFLRFRLSGSHQSSDLPELGGGVSLQMNRVGGGSTWGSGTLSLRDSSENTIMEIALGHVSGIQEVTEVIDIRDDYHVFLSGTGDIGTRWDFDFIKVLVDGEEIWEVTPNTFQYGKAFPYARLEVDPEHPTDLVNLRTLNAQKYSELKYFGDPNEDGSWRTGIAPEDHDYAGDFVIQQRVNGTWVDGARVFVP